MTAKEYLERPGLLQEEIRRRERRIRLLRDMARRVTPQWKEICVQSAPDPCRGQAFLDEIVDLEREIAALDEDRGRALEDLGLRLSRMEDPALAELLALRYLDGLDWPEIARKLCLCESWVFKLHRRALDVLPLPGE